MKIFIHRFKMILPYFLLWLLLVNLSPFRNWVISNSILQFTLFLLVAHIPAWKTKRMSYVDLAWPWGLVLMGCLGLTLGSPLLEGAETSWSRTLLFSTPYLLAGLRMGGMALYFWSQGFFKWELPRYRYQRRRWEKLGVQSEQFSMQFEIAIQGLANASFLSLPLLLGLSGPASPFPLSLLEGAGFLLWLLSFSLETLADHQKYQFGLECKRKSLKRQNCEVGLWKYSRHPNYFFEWMCWNSLILMSLPSLASLYGKLHILSWIGLLVGTLMISKIMYATLVYFTGAVPSEYYSLKKRPAYADYQKRTSRFFLAYPKSSQDRA